MTSQNLELFPDDLFARKGDASPAGHTREGKVEVVALEAKGSDPACDAGDASEGGSRSAASGDDEEALAKDCGGETGEAGEAPEASKTEAKGRATADAAPAASVLELRLLEEVSEDLDEILRCAEGSASPPAEAMETTDFTGEPAVSVQTPEDAGPRIDEVRIDEARIDEARIDESGPTTAAVVPRQTLLWRPATWTPSTWTPSTWTPSTWTPSTWTIGTWTTGTRAIAVALLLAVGLLAGWFAATPPPEETAASGEGNAGVPAAETAGSVESAPAQNALEALSSAESSESAQQPEAETPRVDVVRVEEDGSAIIAGMAVPGAELIVLHNGAPIGVAQADDFGQWVLLPEEPLPEGSHEFGLVVKTVEGSVTLPDPAAPESDAPETGESGGEAGDLPALDPALDEESRLPAPGSKPVQAFAEAPLPPQKPAVHTTNAPAQDHTPPYVVQLASAPSAEGAASEWQRLRKAHPDLLARQDLTVQEADLAGRGAVFRVRTGSFETLLAARRFCAAFRRQNQECLVVKQTQVVKQTEADATAPPRTRLSRNHY